jgi:hypothetical protein
MHSKLTLFVFILFQVITWVACLSSPTDQGAMFKVWVLSGSVLLFWSLVKYSKATALARAGVFSVVATVLVRLLLPAT